MSSHSAGYSYEDFPFAKLALERKRTSIDAIQKEFDMENLKQPPNRIANRSSLIRWLQTAMLFFGLSACGVAPQPERAQTIAAFEVPLPSQSDRNDFQSILRNVAEAEGMHLDAAKDEELDRKASIVKMTVSLAVWRGVNDDEVIASAMDMPDHLGQVWISFFKGEDPAMNSRFREHAMREILRKWPKTLALPIMPTGAIPLHHDLVQTPTGYVVNPTEAHRYQLRSQAGSQH